MSLSDLLANYPKPWANVHLNSLNSNSVTTNTLNVTSFTPTDIDTALVKATNIRGQGAGTTPVTQIRVTTVADPAQKATDVWATNIGTQANKTTNIHATNLFATNLGSPANKVGVEYATTIITDSLNTINPIIANSGVLVSSYHFNDFYAETPFNFTLYGGYLNTNFDTTCRIVGAQRQFVINMNRFDVPSSYQSGSDDKIYFEIPYLQSFEMSGYIPFSTSNDTEAYNIAVVYKPAGASTVSFSPLNNRHFQYGTYAGQDLYFRPGQIFCAEL